ncbi:prephenate dehydratase [Enterococcus florum]|uniref:Prephenate dehydratase n=1 Tax=Enterococcus florum TaxID=2480627 RepID=A0A4P5PBQ3_9ENTE|nr:prephenate dehydratase [Enterococcus florum]GCF93711.1 prephenate dehydratase [Enterococcus florum]
MDIGYLGPKGSFTHAAAKAFFQTETLTSYPTLIQLIDARVAGQIDYAVVPVENTIEGSVLQTIDGIYQNLPTIQGEITLKIEQQLMVRPEYAERWKEAELVCSHPQALAQCQTFIREYFPAAEIEQMASTTLGAKRVAETPQKIIASIGSCTAAREFDLTIVKRNIQSVENNETRFWLLGDQPVESQLNFQRQKATLLVDLPFDRPGALYHLLALFAEAKINLTKIESRPQKTQLGEYFFIIDLEVPKDLQTLDRVIHLLSQQEFPVKFVGNYPTYRKP